MEEQELTKVRRKEEKPPYSFYDWIKEHYSYTPKINEYDCLDNIIISKGRKIL